MKKLSWENLEAETLSRWLTLQWYSFTHIANESGLPPKIAMLAALRKKRMWTSPWFPDYCIILKRGSLLFLELKKKRTRKKNGEYKAISSDWITISPEQAKWIEKLDNIDNVGALIAYWCEEAIEKIQELEKI